MGKKEYMQLETSGVKFQLNLPPLGSSERKSKVVTNT